MEKKLSKENLAEVIYCFVKKQNPPSIPSSWKDQFLCDYTTLPEEDWQTFRRKIISWPSVTSLCKSTETIDVIIGLVYVLQQAEKSKEEGKRKTSTKKVVQKLVSSTELSAQDLQTIAKILLQHSIIGFAEYSKTCQNLFQEEEEVTTQNNVVSFESFQAKQKVTPVEKSPAEQEIFDLRQDFEKQAARGDAYSMYCLGIMNKFGQGGEKNLDQAKAWYEKAAKHRFIDAMFELALLYDDGRWAHYDTEKARIWYEKAANQGHTSAMNNLGMMFYYGLGGVENREWAKKLFEKAAALGCAEAICNLGVIANDPIVARKFFSKASELGSADAMYNLATTYKTSKRSDYKKAYEIFEKASMMGNFDATYQLGLMNQYGQGVPQNIKKAVEYYKKAAEEGQADAMYQLGDIYREGSSGVKKNEELAEEWYKKANTAEYGDDELF